jgi:hypothetical protein
MFPGPQKISFPRCAYGHTRVSYALGLQLQYLLEYSPRPLHHTTHAALVRLVAPPGSR